MIHELTQGDDGRTVGVHMGDILQVNLPENPTTGYRWKVHECDDAILTFEGVEFHPEGTVVVGGGGVRVFEFRAVAPGTTPLQLKLLRQWEGDGSIMEWFRAAIDVTSKIE
jgi:inhibitor of cysteine peptidase